MSVQQEGRLMRLVFLVVAIALAAICLLPAASVAEEPSALSAQANLTPVKPKPTLTAPGGPWAGNPAQFFAGAFVGFLGHETGHLITNTAMDTHPYLKPIQNGPIPFFTIEPGRPLNRHEHYITSSAGFNATNIIDEWLLVSHPRLSQENQPFLKGMASFNFWVNVGYAATAFAQTGPDERDTKGMADSLGCSEWAIGAMILVPTGLDTYRYKHPDAKWAATLSRIAKLYMIFLAVKVHD
jgi:hypothetical protein